MKISKTLLELASTPRRILMYLAMREVRVGKIQTFAQFTSSFRVWTRQNQGDRLLEYCLRKLAAAELITLSGTLVTNDLALSLTVQGEEIAREAYQLAQNGINDFANLLPAAAPVAASAVDPTASQRTSPLFNIAPLGSRPAIVNSEMS